MPAHIPAGREDLWRRQAEADAELERLSSAVDAAERHRNDLAEALGWDDSIVEDADHELDQLLDRHNQAVARSDRIYQERTAGLTWWIDHDPTAPICPDCKGTGGPPGSDALTACPTCRGWGREHRDPIPVWSDENKQWINPATGRPVDLLAEPADPPPAAQPYRKPNTTPGRRPMSDTYDAQIAEVKRQRTAYRKYGTRRERARDAGKDFLSWLLELWERFFAWLWNHGGPDTGANWKQPGRPRKPRYPRGRSERINAALDLRKPSATVSSGRPRRVLPDILADRIEAQRLTGPKPLDMSAAKPRIVRWLGQYPTPIPVPAGTPGRGLRQRASLGLPTPKPLNLRSEEISNGR